MWLKLCFLLWELFLPDCINFIVNIFSKDVASWNRNLCTFWREFGILDNLESIANSFNKSVFEKSKWFVNTFSKLLSD